VVQSGVRRAARLNVPLTKTTLDGILSRTCEVDPVTGRLVYAGGLQNKLAHPRHLIIAQREMVIKDGLGDRGCDRLVASSFDAAVAAAQQGDV